jgi:Prokaryotic E2 family E
MALIPESDEQYLREKGFDYEIKSVSSEVHVVLKNWQFPQTYEPTTASLRVRILPGYPLSPLDMFWTFPDIRLANGTWPLNADVHENLDGHSWQRWSRHYEWRAGVDNLRTFITAITAEINIGR